MEGRKYYGLEEDPIEQAPQKQSFVNDWGNIINGINQTRILTRQDRELNDLKWDYMYNPDLTEEQQNEMAKEYDRKYEEMMKTAREIQRSKDYLNASDSTLAGVGKHALSFGSSLESLESQYGTNLASALAGAAVGSTILPGLGTIGGFGAGWKLANIPTAIRANYRDAEAGAYDTMNEVLEKTGDPELAQKAYYESLKPNLAYAALATIPDVAIASGSGKALTGFAKKAFGEGSKALAGANRIAQVMEGAKASRIGRMVDKIPDLEFGEKAGAWAAGKFNNPLIGKAVRGGVNLGLEVGSELGQETEQGVSTDVEVARALHQYDPSKYAPEEGWSVGKVVDWWKTPQGKETMLDTAVSTLLGGGAPVALGAFNRLNAGYNYKSNLQQADNIVNDIQRGAINIDNEVYSGIKNAIGAANGLDDSQTSALSDKDVIRQVLEDNTDRAISMGMNEKDANAFAVNETIKLLNGEVATTANLGYTTATTEAFAKQHGLDISNLTNMEKRRQQEQEARQKALTQAKEAHKGTITDDTTPYSEKDKEAGTGKPIEVEQEQQKTTGQSSSSSLSNLFSNGFGQHWRVKQNAVDSNGNEYSDDIAILENSKTGRVVQVQKLDNGKISVLDITPEGATDENGKPVEASTKKTGRLSDKIGNKRVYFGTDADGIAALTKYMVSQENQTKTLKQEEDQANNEVKIADPNRRRVLVNSVHDLSNFYRNNKDLMDRDTFMMTARAMLAFGNGNVSIDLDLENQQAGKRGETTLPDVQNGVSKAIISLYSGADAMTVVHEFAHVGYDMMSANDKLLFNQMALASETEFVCSLLRANYPMFKNMEDSQILQLITKKDNATLVAANEVGAIRQTIDIINGSADAEQRQVACEERYAWEFSTWYAAGYTKGIAPDNQIHSMLNRTMRSLGKALNLISTISARLQSPNWQAIQSDRSMVTMFENMNTRTFDTGGRENVRRMYGGLRTQGEQQGQVQEGQQMPSMEEQIQSNDSLQPSLFSPENMNQEQVDPTYIQQELFDNNSGNIPNVVTTNRNRQRRERDIQSQNERMQPVYINELNKIVNKNRNVTREEVDMVMNLSDDNYQKYAKKVLASKNPNEERLELLSYVDQSRGNMFADRIREKMNDRELDNVLFPKAKSKSGKENAEQARNARVSNNEVVDSLETQAENRINNIVNKLIELDQKGEKSLNGYISKNKDKFESKTEGVHVYKEALKRFKKNREKYKAIRQKENERFAADDKQRKEQELQDYLSQNEESIQDKYKKLMDKYEKDGLEAVKKTMDSPAIKKDPRLWNEAYSRLQKDVQEREEQRKEEEAKAFEEDVQKVLGLINEKKQKGEGSLKMFLINKKFKTDPAYIEAKKRFNAEQQEVAQQPQPVAQEKKEVAQPNPQPQPQQKQQPVEEVSQEVQEQPQQQAGKQVAEVERPKKGLPRKEFEEGLEKPKDHKFRKGNGLSYDEQLEIEKELFGEVGKLNQSQFDELNYNALEAKDNYDEEVAEEKPVAKEEANNGKTEDSGRVGDLRVPQGTLQGGGNSRSSTNQQPVLQPRQRVELEGTEARHGEDISLLNKTEEKPKTKPKAEPKQKKIDNSDILMGKNGKPIGSMIAEVNGKDSKTTQRLVKEAYDGKEPTDLFGWRNITKGTNKNGDNAVAIFNKLFGTKLKPEDYYGGNIYVNKEGTAGYAVNANGFCTVEVSGKQKGLLANAILVARSTKGVNYIVANTDGFAMASICSRLGFSPSGVLSINGEQKLVLAKEELQEEDLAKKISNTKYEKIDTEDIPIFYGVEGLQDYENIVATSADKKQLTRKEQRTVFERVVRAVEGFPDTSTDELQYLIETIDKTLDNKNSKSKINTENLYLMNVLKSAAQEEIGNRGEDVQKDSEGEIVNDYSSVLESLYGAQELAELRKQSKGDTETAQELLSKAMKPWLAREEKEQNATLTEADNDQIESKNAKQTDTAKSDLGSILDKLEKGLEEMDKEQDYAKRVLEAEQYQEANIEDFDVDEDFGNLTDEELESRMGKSKKARQEEKKEVKSEQEEEIDAMEASEEEIPKDAKPKNIHIVNKNVEKINRYDTEDDWHRVCMSTITSDKGRNTGIKESEDVRPSEVRDFLDMMEDKYEKGSATTLEEGILGRDIDEEDKKELGRIYRKLCRQKLLMDERFTKGLYGDWTDKTGDIFHIRTHAVNYYKRLNRSLLGRVKMIMRNNGIHAFEYGFDEKDTKKKLTQKKLDEQRKVARNLQEQIEQLKATREALKGQEKTRKQRNKLRRTISLLEDALNEVKISVWANGQDMQGLTGKNKFRQEYAELREAAERAAERRKERENRPAKSVDRDLENSRRKRTMRKRQKEAEQRMADSTPTLNKELTIDNSMRGYEVNWKKYVGNKKEQVSPILDSDKVATVADLMKFKSIPELVEMVRQGQDVDGMLNKINYMINTAVRYTQIDKNKAQQLKDRVADFKKAFNEALTAPRETPQKITKTTAKKNKSTPTTKTTAPTTGSTTMSDEVYENMKKEIFDNLTGKTETIKKLTTEQLVKKIESASGQKLSDKQKKNLGNRLKAEQSRPPRKTKENKTNKSNTNKPNGRKRSQETDTTIPETAVEENRDVYSFTFTKDALAQSKVNRDKAKQYEKDDKYWKTEHNEDGSVTFTRQKPLPHHTKNITYSGVNGRKVEKQKFGKLSQAWNWFADTMTQKWFNNQDAIKELAAMVGAPESWMRFVVTKDIGSVATSAIERGIVKHDSKTHERTASLKSIANAIPKDKQWDFLDYCEAYRVKYDLHPKGIEQKMTLETAEKIINDVESGEDAKLFKEQREKFIEYNKELLHVLVDGDIITEDFYQALVRDHPNFIPLSKDMSDFDAASDYSFASKSLINVNNPLHRIGTSMREIKNPLLEMQKRTFDYYQRAADNKAARIFIDEIVNKITTNAEGDEVLLNQAILHKLKPQYKKDGTIKDISDPNKGIFYVMKDGKKEFYQLSDASVYKALRSMSPEQMTQFGKFVRWALSRPAAFVRFFATFTPDFGFGNLIRDNGEAFLTSRHGFIPLYDSLWGMWQMYTDSEWFKEYNSQVGEMGTRMRESERVAIDQQTMKDKVKNSLFVSPFFTLNEYLEQGTRIGEYKNARMGYKGTLGRLTDTRNKTLAEADKSGRDKTYAAYRSKDITLDFQQHGEWSKEINKYIPFFNASMQGLYKVLNFIDEAVHNKEGMRAEFLLKASLISFLAMSAGIHGAGDDDYEEAPDWEKDNYYVLGNGLRIPKDQVLGKLIGNSMELLGYQMAKGEIKLDEAGKQLVHDIKNAVIPDNLMPAFMNLAIGVAGDYDMFRQKHITPEYLQNKISYLQKDLSTSQMSSDLSWAIYQATGAEIGAKKINFAFDNLFSNTMKYVNRMYDFVKEEATGKKENQKVGHMYLDADSKWSSDYLTSNTGSNVMDTTLDIMKMMVGKKFIQNQTSFKSVENFNEEYRRLKRLSSDPEAMTKQEQKLFTQFYEPAMKKIKANQKKLSEINKNESWDKTQKLEKARPIILKNIEIARWANSKSKA